ncbi:MAG TPA: DUF2127 domain-containing protein [Candidatus Paceibacterota bacterium]|nr:DUF2127 domain-containing protein [Candidatus Paceibacterota bacterium]
MDIEFTPREEKRIGLYFKISVLLKGAISLGELIAGIALLFIPVSYFLDLLAAYAESELQENANSFIASSLLSLAHQAAAVSGTFIAIYILSRGLIKVLLIWAMLKNRLWAYPSSLVVLGLFVIYQLYELVITGSYAIVVLSIFDLVVMYFIWREYQVLKFEA